MEWIKLCVQAYLNVFAVRWKIHLNDKAWDVLTVAYPVQGCALREVIKVNSVLLGTHCQKPVIRADSRQQGGKQNRRLLRQCWASHTVQDFFTWGRPLLYLGKATCLKANFSTVMDTVSPKAWQICEALRCCPKKSFRPYELLGSEAYMVLKAILKPDMHPNWISFLDHVADIRENAKIQLPDKSCSLWKVLICSSKSKQNFCNLLKYII